MNTYWMLAMVRIITAVCGKKPLQRMDATVLGVTVLIGVQTNDYKLTFYPHRSKCFVTRLYTHSLLQLLCWYTWLLLLSEGYRPRECLKRCAPMRLDL